jgi:hypothetical protein
MTDVFLDEHGFRIYEFGRLLDVGIEEKYEILARQRGLAGRLRGRFATAPSGPDRRQMQAERERDRLALQEWQRVASRLRG